MTKTSSFLKVNSDKVQYSEDAITSQYTYQTVTTTVEDGEIVATPVETKYEFKTQTTVPKTGVMFVGLGGNNGTTVMAGVLANKLGLSWGTKEGGQSANYFGSLTQASTIRVGTSTETGKDTYVPFSGIVPMVNPDNLVIGGWDINNMNMADAMERAKVLDYDLQRQLRPHMEAIVPLPSVYEEDFIASNQKERANHVLKGTKAELVETLRADIRNFKAENGLDKVIVLWTANTERFCEVSPELNGTKAALLASIEADKVEVSPSTLFAVAALKEGCPYINGSPQNALVPGVIEMAKELRVPVAGDDFKTGQTKIKSVLVDFLVSAGIKPISIVSYNHLGNNDGKNLQSQKTFASKEKSKANVVDDMIESNNILYAEGEHPDHCVVIKYVPAVGDSKRALDEYTSEIFLGGKNTIVMHNTCEDSLLAAPLILDLVILTELFSRISFKTEDMDAHTNVHPVLSILSFLLKAPVVPEGAPVVNALFAQRAAIVNTLRACVGLPPVDDMRMGQMTL